jgi:hypothetical protein
MVSYITSSEKKENATRMAEQADSRNANPPPEPLMEQQEQQPQLPSLTFHTPLYTPSSLSPVSIRAQIPAVTASAQEPILESRLVQALPQSPTILATQPWLHHQVQLVQQVLPQQQQQPPTLLAAQPSLHHQAQLVQQILANQQLLPQLKQELIKQVLGIQQQQTPQLQLSAEVLRTLLPQLQPNAHPTARPAPIVSMHMPVVGRTTTSSSAVTTSGPVLSALSNAPAPGLALDPAVAATLRLLLQEQIRAPTPLTMSPSIDDASMSGPRLMQLLKNAVEQHLQQQQSRQQEEETILQIILAALQRDPSYVGGAQHWIANKETMVADSAQSFWNHASLFGLSTKATKPIEVISPSWMQSLQPFLHLCLFMSFILTPT